MLPQNPSVGNGEIDIFEAYTQFTSAVCSTLHDWTNTSNSVGSCPNLLPNNIQTETGYHIYGLLWTPTTMNFYVDGNLYWSHAPLAVMNGPYYLLVDLGIGGGWPTTSTTSPSTCRVKYIRAYAP